MVSMLIFLKTRSHLEPVDVQNPDESEDGRGGGGGFRVRGVGRAAVGAGAAAAAHEAGVLGADGRVEAVDEPAKFILS